jgi:hypothetical protein
MHFLFCLIFKYEATMGLRVPTTRLGRVDGVIAYGTEQRSFGLSFMAAIEGTADVRNRAGRLVDCRLCRVGPGNFTPSPSQIRT